MLAGYDQAALTIVTNVGGLVCHRHCFFEVKPLEPLTSGRTRLLQLMTAWTYGVRVVGRLVQLCGGGSYHFRCCTDVDMPWWPRSAATRDGGCLLVIPTYCSYLYCHGTSGYFMGGSFNVHGAGTDDDAAWRPDLECFTLFASTTPSSSYWGLRAQ